MQIAFFVAFKSEKQACNRWLYMLRMD